MASAIRVSGSPKKSLGGGRKGERKKKGDRVGPYALVARLARFEAK